MVKRFLDLYVNGGYRELVGYNVSFDFRFIVAKCMFYNLFCKELIGTGLYDLMQVMKQVKQAFVFGSNKAGKLSDWSEYFFNFPKEITDAEMWKAYAEGNLGIVMSFAENQVRRTMMLYHLFNYVALTPITEQSFGNPGIKTTSFNPMLDNTFSKLSIPEANAPNETVIQCANCLANNTILDGETQFTCDICGEPLR